MVIKCPHCRIPLTETEYQSGTPVFWCNLCSGIWVNAQELYKIMEVASKDIPVAAQNDAKTCPKCESRVFYPVNFPGTSVVIDICKNCKGVWFDKGELHAIKKAVIDEETGEQDKHEAASEKIAAWVNKILESLKAF